MVRTPVRHFQKFSVRLGPLCSKLALHRKKALFGLSLLALFTGFGHRKRQFQGEVDQTCHFTEITVKKSENPVTKCILLNPKSWKKQHEPTGSRKCKEVTRNLCRDVANSYPNRLRRGAPLKRYWQKRSASSALRVPYEFNS